MLRTHLAQQSEPCSAAEISSALGQDHPDRNIKNTVVRTSLKGLVAKGHARRTKQGSSVFYTAAATQKPAAAEPEAAAG
ncbi:BlaI/MecI/CopY family transcriptional regulator [Streptomyces aureocirculatus]|uniref:BlaI/MecI/CopY family transcriptional regulator n=1 Tax=Streptomyces aureocirculatus TaxID=67275 RepID=UPI00068DDE08|nr:BlaI/MecI/CopY family transcriptional regulator [Streptomyces aureocirculatus]